jgi:hypothetical protein
MKRSCAGAASILLAICTVCHANTEAFEHSRRMLQLADIDISPATANATDDCCAQLNAIGFSSNLPVVIIDSSGDEVLHKVWMNSRICTCGAENDFDGPAEIAGRGSSSANFAKKSYKLKLRRPEGGKWEFPFLDMPEHNHWIL